MSTPTEHEWELNRENVRPLRGGRTVRSINSAFGDDKMSIREAEAKFESDMEAAERVSDPLDLCVKYVNWFEERFPTGKKSHLYRMLVRIVNTYGSREEYLNDERMMKMWFKLADNKPGVSADAFFERAFTAGCCRRLAKFYVRWAELREDVKDVGGARTVLRRGRENGAEPEALLIEAQDALEMRQVRAMQEEEFDDSDAELEAAEQRRIALGGLECPLSTPVFRDSYAIATGLATNSQAMPKKSSQTSAGSFEIFQDGDEFEDAGLLVPQNFGEDLGRIEFAENRKDPVKWKDARIDGIKSSQRLVNSSFEVFDEAEYKKRRKEKRALELAMSRLLVVDELVSIEELHAAWLDRRGNQC